MCLGGEGVLLTYISQKFHPDEMLQRQVTCHNIGREREDNAEDRRDIVLAYGTLMAKDLVEPTYLCDMLQSQLVSITHGSNKWLYPCLCLDMQLDHTQPSILALHGTSLHVDSLSSLPDTAVQCRATRRPQRSPACHVTHRELL